MLASVLETTSTVTCYVYHSSAGSLIYPRIILITRRSTKLPSQFL